MAGPLVVGAAKLRTILAPVAMGVPPTLVVYQLKVGLAVPVADRVTGPEPHNSAGLAVTPVTVGVVFTTILMVETGLAHVLTAS